MILHAPFMISSRLMPAVEVGGAVISLGNGPRNAEGRTVYGCWIDLPDGQSFEITDLCSGCGGGGVQEGMGNLLGFLSAAAESYQYAERHGKDGMTGENSDLFERPIVEWAAQHSDEIGCLCFEIEESETPLIED